MARIIAKATGAIAGLLCAALLLPPPAHACSCARGATQAQAIAASHVVFQGRVVDVRREGQQIFATINVIRPIKGNVRTNVEVGTRAP